MTFALVTTQHFERRARKFLRKHPDLRPLLHDTLDQLSRDPFAPRLKLHALGGKLTGVQTISLTHSYRLTLILEGHRRGDSCCSTSARTMGSIGEAQG